MKSPQPAMGTTGPAGSRPVVVVTGGSEGIGLAIARRYGAAGRDLLLVARRADTLEAAAAALRTAHPAIDVATLALDVTAPDAPHRITAALSARGAHTDLLVNSAGIGMSGPFASRPPDEIDRLIALNIAALTALCRHVLPPMQQRRQGGIINVASLAGLGPTPSWAVYAASKAYVLSFTEALAVEVRGDGIRVTAVAPGPVATGFHARIGAEGDLYRRLLPTQDVETVARWAVAGHRLGLRVVVPGLFYNLVAVAMRLAPRRILAPILGWLFAARGRD